MFSIIKIVKLVCKISKVSFSDVIKKTKDRVGKDQMYKLNCTRTRKELNWKSNVTLVRGINKLKDYYLHNK